MLTHHLNVFSLQIFLTVVLFLPQSQEMLLLLIFQLLQTLIFLTVWTWTPDKHKQVQMKHFGDVSRCCKVKNTCAAVRRWENNLLLLHCLAVFLYLLLKSRRSSEVFFWCLLTSSFSSLNWRLCSFWYTLDCCRLSKVHAGISATTQWEPKSCY